MVTKTNLQVELCELTGHRATYDVQASAAEPTVTADSEYVLDHTGPGGGPRLVRVLVEGPDGRSAVAWVRAILNDRGQVQFELSTNKRENATRRVVTANWRL